MPDLTLGTARDANRHHRVDDLKPVLLVAVLAEAKDIPHDGMQVLSCNQSPKAYYGLMVGAVWATKAAQQHRDYDKALAVLKRMARKPSFRGLDRVI